MAGAEKGPEQGVDLAPPVGGLDEASEPDEVDREFQKIVEAAKTPLPPITAEELALREFFDNQPNHGGFGD